MKESSAMEKQAGIWWKQPGGLLLDHKLTDGACRVASLIGWTWNISGCPKGLEPNKLSELYNIRSSQLSFIAKQLVANGYLTIETLKGNRKLYCPTSKLTGDTPPPPDRGEGTDSKESSSAEYILCDKPDISTTCENSYAESQLSFNQRWIKAKPQLTSHIKQLKLNATLVQSVEIHWRSRPAVPLNDIIQILSNIAKSKKRVENIEGYIVRSMENILIELPLRNIQEQEEKTKQTEKNYAELIRHKEHIYRICSMLNNDEHISSEELYSKLPENTVKQWIEKDAIVSDTDKLWYSRGLKYYFRPVDTVPYIISNPMYELAAAERNHKNIPCIEHLKQTILEGV